MNVEQLIAILRRHNPKAQVVGYSSSVQAYCPLQFSREERIVDKGENSIRLYGDNQGDIETVVLYPASWLVRQEA